MYLSGMRLYNVLLSELGDDYDVPRTYSSNELPDPRIGMVVLAKDETDALDIASNQYRTTLNLIIDRFRLVKISLITDWVVCRAT